MSLQTATALANALPAEYWRRECIDFLHANLVFHQLGQKVKLPKNNGDTVNWYAYSSLSADTNALTEGVAPSGQSLTVNTVSANLAQYGNIVKLTDWVRDILVSDPMKQAMKIIEYQAALSIDTIIRNVLDTALPNQFANGESALSAVGSSDVLTAKEILKAVITNKKNDVMPRDGGRYAAVIHPAAEYDLLNDTNVGSANDVLKHADPKKLLNGQIGSIYSCDLMSSSNVSSTTSGTESSATVYSMPVMGADAFGVVDLEGSKDKRNFRIFIKEPGSAGSSDPLDQVATVGYKIHGFAAKYLGGASLGLADLGVRIRAGSQG